MNSHQELRDKILQIALDSLKTAQEYKGFKKIQDQLGKFRNDPVWSLFGIDNVEFLKLRYIGNYYTAIFRKFGDMYEKFVRVIIQDCLGLNENQIAYEFSLTIEGETQQRSLDAKILVSEIAEETAKARVQRVIRQIAPSNNYDGIVLEVRCCYQIGDSKRINADEDAGKHVKQQNLLPVLMIFCTTSLPSPVKRLKKTWHVTEGMASYDLLRNLTGFDLYGCLQELRPDLQEAMKKVRELFSSFR